MTRDRTTPDIYTRVTDTIIAELEKGVRPWVQNWKGENRFQLPRRANGVSYRGINIVLLWIASFNGGYQQPRWMTYKQAQELNAQVRKGEKGTTIVHYGTIVKEEADQGEETSRKEIPYLKSYTVFNVDQIEGLPEGYRVEMGGEIPEKPLIPALEMFVSATGATIVSAGNPHHSQGRDTIGMPPIGSFHDAEGYYCTLAHELIHWTAHPKRLDRTFPNGGRFGTEGYAREELVAELGAAFLAAALDITPTVREDHAEYLGGWLKILKKDKRAILQAAAHAQKAADYLLEFSTSKRQ
jgi:antirestriction protein ArdC